MSLLKDAGDKSAPFDHLSYDDELLLDDFDVDLGTDDLLGLFDEDLFVLTPVEVRYTIEVVEIGQGGFTAIVIE